jgi:drug/metabolite transporter (DMT)-like permease
VLCALLAVAGNTTLVAALQRSDLSVLGPINAYKPVVSLLPGVVLLHEIPTLWQLSGIGLIIFGSIIVVSRDGQAKERGSLRLLFRERGIQLRFAALVFSAVEAVFLKRALLESSPAGTFALWAIFGLGFSAAAIAAGAGRNHARSDLKVLTRNWFNYLWLALTTGIMQLSTLITLKVFTVGPALALFQTSTILTVILGRTVFVEKHFVKRIMGSLVMIAGAIIIIIWK